MVEETRESQIISGTDICPLDLLAEARWALFISLGLACYVYSLDGVTVRPGLFIYIVSRIIAR